jgi:hypothetical protein
MITVKSLRRRVSRRAFGSVAIAMFVAIGVIAIPQIKREAAAAGAFQIVVPNIAADVVAARPRPTPTAAPFDSDRWVNIQMNITAKELAVGPSGTVEVPIVVSASAKLPTVLEGPVTVTGTAFVQPHVVDSAGCTWSRTFSNPEFKMTVYYSGDLSVIVSADGPDWYYDVICPPSSRTVRFPASGSVPLRLYLQYTMAAYRVADGVRLPTEVISETPISCLKRKGTFNQTAFNAHAVIQVYVYQPGFPGGCLLPVLE